MARCKLLRSQVSEGVCGHGEGLGAVRIVSFNQSQVGVEDGLAHRGPMRSVEGLCTLNNRDTILSSG
jgi:hypothetical protein